MSVEAQGRPPEVFSPRVAIILFLVGVFSFSAFITLSTFAPDFMDGNNGQAHALSKSAIGYAGTVKLLQAQGTRVQVSRTGPSGLSTTLVVLTPQSNVKLEDIERLAYTNALIVLPKWLPIPSFTRPGWVRESGPYSETTIAEILKGIAPKARIKQETGAAAPALQAEPNNAWLTKNPGTLRPGKIAALQTVVAPELIPLVTTKDGKTVLGVVRDREEPAIYVLTEPDLLNNQGIADVATARAGMAVLAALNSEGDPITFDVTLNGFERSRSLLRLAFEPPLLAATLSFVIVAAMLAWRAATRSGPTARGKRAIALGKRTLADNSAALIRLAGRDHTMAPRYAQMVRTVVAEQIHVARDASETTNAELDRIAQSRGVPATYSELAAEAAAATTATETLNTARRLHAWTGDMIRATR
jgi:hypothetical protein